MNLTGTFLRIPQESPQFTFVVDRAQDVDAIVRNIGERVGTHFSNRISRPFGAFQRSNRTFEIGEAVFAELINTPVSAMASLADIAADAHRLGFYIADSIEFASFLLHNLPNFAQLMPEHILSGASTPEKPDDVLVVSRIGGSHDPYFWLKQLNMKIPEGMFLLVRESVE